MDTPVSSASNTLCLLIPICLHALEEQLHQYKPLNISSGCWVHFLFGLMSEFASRIVRVITYIYSPFKILHKLLYFQEWEYNTYLLCVYQSFRFLSI